MDRDEFGLHMDYAAQLGKIVVPWALSLRDDTILFTGSDPFSAEELSSLLPGASLALRWRGTEMDDASETKDKAR